MPFKSEKQRRWMWANDPEMAKRWEDEEGDDEKNEGAAPMKITRRQLKGIIQEEITRITEGEIVNLPDPKLPWEFGPEGYIKRPELRQKMSDLEFGSDSPPELILSIALSNRAEEMIGYKQTVDPEPFKDLAMRLYKDYIIGMAGNVEQNLHDITSRIDAGDYFDEEIIDVIGNNWDFIEDIANRYLPDPMYDKVASAEDGSYVVDGSIVTDPEDSGSEQLQALRATGVTHVVDNDGDGRTHTLDDWEDKVQMATTQDLAAQQDPGEVEEMGMDFERFLQGIETEED